MINVSNFIRFYFFISPLNRTNRHCSLFNRTRIKSAFRREIAVDRQPAFVYGGHDTKGCVTRLIITRLPKRLFANRKKRFLNELKKKKTISDGRLDPMKNTNVVGKR